MSRQYRKFSVKQKANVARLPLRDNVPVGELAEVLRLQPTAQL